MLKLTVKHHDTGGANKEKGPSLRMTLLRKTPIKKTSEDVFFILGLVEAAGLEPASEKPTLKALHA